LLHQAGFVHRDLSPGNIVVVDGKAKISDLEFVKVRRTADLQRLAEEHSPLTAVDARTVSHFVVVFGHIFTS
jgi:serine/threonine protein kinase